MGSSSDAHTVVKLMTTPMTLQKVELDALVMGFTRMLDDLPGFPAIERHWRKFHNKPASVAFWDEAEPDAYVAAVVFDRNAHEIEELDKPSQALLALLMVLEHEAPEVKLKIDTSAPKRFLAEALELAQLYAPSMVKPSWLPESLVETLEVPYRPDDMDFRS